MAPVKHNDANVRLQGDSFRAATTFAEQPKWKGRPIKDLATLDAFPSAARQREINKAASTFASTGRNVFVHYVEPILSARRTLHLASGSAKRGYYKSAAQLWQVQDEDAKAFWNEKARELRLCLKQKLLSAEDCLRHAGRASELAGYVSYAERAVAAYLGLPPSSQSFETARNPGGSQIECMKTIRTLDASESALVNYSKSITFDDGSAEYKVPVAAHEADAESLDFDGVPSTQDVNEEVANDAVDTTCLPPLLDTLPDPFEITSKIMYEPFAIFEPDHIRQLEGKHQIAELRRIADMMHKSGKDLFHHFMYPRLCKFLRPPVNGATVASVSANIWQYLRGSEKEQWLIKCRSVKQQLGDGDVLGLDRIQLDSVDGEVLRLHRLAESALKQHLSEPIGRHLAQT